MKAIAVCLTLLAASALAQEPEQARLIGQRVVSSFAGSPVLVCRYEGSEARYEVVASSKRCAPSLRLSDEPRSERPAALARSP
jgi:hypothetical protein